MKGIKLCCCLLLACAILVQAVPVKAAETTILTGKVRTTVTRSPSVHFNGVVDEVLVKPGDRVTRGQPILRYVLQDEARRALQREVNNGANTETMHSQMIDLKRQLAQATAQRNKARSLAASGLGSNQASDRMQYDVTSLEERIALIEISIKKAQDNFNLRLDELSDYFNTPIQEGQPLPEYLYLKSPIDGFVLSIATTMNPGATFNGGFQPVSIGQLDPILIQVPVYEAEVSALQLGDTAKVEIPSLGNRNFTGTITEIAWVSNQMDVAQASYFNVELTIPNPDLELKPGFKAVVRFTLN